MSQNKTKTKPTQNHQTKKEPPLQATSSQKEAVPKTYVHSFPTPKNFL